MPVVYFDDTVPKHKKKVYKQIVERFGGKVTSKLPLRLRDDYHDDDDDDDSDNDENHRHKPNTKELVTHVVAWDEEEHDNPENVLRDESIRSHPESTMLEKLYLRTIVVVQPEAKKTSGILESTMASSKKKGGKVKEKHMPQMDQPMALVHWWYWPSSYDEWMPKEDVSGDQEDMLASRLYPNGPWVVGAKFIRDVENFNEWGLEEDYAILD